MSDLTIVNNTLKEQNELLKGNKAQDLENIREKDRKDAELLKILRDLKPTVNINGKEDQGSFLKALLTGFGLIGAGAIGLASGLAAGWVVYVGALIKDIGKIVTKLIKMIPKPKWVDEIFDVLKNVGGNMFTKIKNFFVGETGFVKRIGKIIDGMIDAVRNFTGGIFTKIKTFFVGEAGFMKKTGTIVDTTTDAVRNFTGGIFTKISNFFVGETGFIKRMTKIADGVFDTLKNFTGGAFTKIAAPFKWLRVNTTTGSIIGDMIDGVMKIFKTGAGEGGFIARLFKGIKSVFSSLSSMGSVIMAPINAITSVFGAVKGAGGGIIDTILGILKPLGSIFGKMAKLGKFIAAPLTIIMALFDAGFEVKDAVEKSEGFFATILNGIFGAVGGFIDGAIFQMADLLKDGIAWIAGFFGFGEVEKQLNSFSFSKIFNEFLDGVYNFVNGLFNLDIAALANSLIPEGSALRRILPDSLFESSGGGALTKPTGMSIKEFESLRGTADIDQKALEMVMMSRQNEAASGTKAPVVIQQDNRQDNRQSMNQTTSLNAPASTRTNESTVRALQMN